MNTQWISSLIAKPFKYVDEEAIKEILFYFRKYGFVENVMKYINYETLRCSTYNISYLLAGHNTLMFNKTPGIDNITNEMFISNIKEYLETLLKEIKEKKYHMGLVKRIEIPKKNNKGFRPLSIPCTRDKILHSTMVNQILEPITEDIFTEESFGCRRDKSVYEAIKYIKCINSHEDIEYALKLDIKGFFDNINHDILIRMVKDIIKDKNFIYLIRNILNTKYMKGSRTYTQDIGIYQGLNISPVLANLYLHNVIDSWYKEIYPNVFMVRYMDDVLFLGRENDIYNLYSNIEKRLYKYKLTLSKEKTKIINILEDDLEFLGLRITFTHKSIKYFITEEKIASIKDRLFEIIKYLYSELNIRRDKEEYIMRFYITKINNILEGVYRTYNNISNKNKLEELYIYVTDILLKMNSLCTVNDIYYYIDHVSIVHY